MKENQSTKKANHVYYVVQTQPVLRTCAITFEKDRAEKLSLYIKKLTGVKGKIVEFSKNELQELDFSPLVR
jgi:hypothetical protein